MACTWTMRGAPAALPALTGSMRRTEPPTPGSLAQAWPRVMRSWVHATIQPRFPPNPALPAKAPAAAPPPLSQPPSLARPPKRRSVVPVMPPPVLPVLGIERRPEANDDRATDRLHRQTADKRHPANAAQPPDDNGTPQAAQEGAAREDQEKDGAPQDGARPAAHQALSAGQLTEQGTAGPPGAGDGRAAGPSGDAAQGAPDAPVSDKLGSAQRYDGIVRAQQQLIDRISGELRNVLQADRLPKYEGAFHAGKLNTKRYLQSRMRAARGGRVDNRPFDKRVQFSKRDVEVVFCLDTSSSMRGANMDAAEQALVVLCEILKALEIPYSVVTFSYNAQVIKDASHVDPEGGALLERIHVSGATQDAKARTLAADILTHSQAQKRLMFFLTDGAGPNPDGQRNAIVALENEVPEIKVLGIGIGAGCEAVRPSYPHALVVDTLDDLPVQLIGALERAIYGH